MSCATAITNGPMWSRAWVPPSPPTWRHSGLANSDWFDGKLADACSSIDYGLTAAATNSDAGPRFLRITDIVGGSIDWNSVPHVVADPATAAKFRLDDGDIVIARTGASTGTSAYIKSPPHAVFASYLVRLKAKEEFDSRFLAYYLKSDAFWSFIRGVLGDKSAQPNASASTMTQAPLRAPRSIGTQRAIAHILGTLDDKIELNRRTNETLEAIARALFKSWFVDFDPVRAKAEGRDPGLPAHLADLFPDSFEDSELGEIPKGWHTAAVSDLADVNARTLGRSDPLDAIDYVEISEVTRGQVANIVRYERGTEPSRARRRLTHGDTVLSTVRPDRGAYFLCLNPPKTLIASTGFAVVSPRDGNWAFLYSALTRSEIGHELGRLADGGAYPAIRPDAIGGLRLVSPQASETRSAFDELARPLYERSEQNRMENRLLTALRDSLLPRLISGELRVSAPQAGASPTV